MDHIATLQKLSLGAIAVAIFVMLWLAIHEQTHSRSAPDVFLVTQSVASQTNQSSEDASGESGRRERELAAQEQMAFLSVWSVIATWLGVILLFATLRETARATNAASVAAVASQAAVEAHIRVEGPLLHLQEVLNPAPGTIWISVKNSGKSPATLIFEAHDFRRGTTDFPSSPVYPNYRDAESEILSPGLTSKRLVAIRKSDKPFDEELPLIVFGCIVYKDVFGKMRSWGYGVRTTSILETADGKTSMLWGQGGGSDYNFDRVDVRI